MSLYPCWFDALRYPGINACIFAYGQTGSGKTYSMVGDMPQQGTGQAESISATTTKSTDMLSGGNDSPDGSEKEGTADSATSEEKTHATSHSNPQDKHGTVLAGERAGVIPRAVEEMFRFVRQGGVGEGTPATSAGSRRRSLSLPSSRDGSREPQNDSQAVAPPATAGRSDDPASAPSISTASSRQSSCSSRSSSSDDLPFEQVQSAAHWPLGEPTVYVPRSESPEDPTSCLVRKSPLPHDSETFKAVGIEEDGGNKENLDTCQDVCAVECIARNKFSVECSYMQVRTLAFENNMREVGVLVIWAL